MAYVRKTTDEYDIEGNYGHGDGWEVVTCEATWKEARRAVKEHRDNEGHQGQFRIRKRRVPIEQAA